MRSKASLRRNTFVRPSCNPAMAHLVEKSKARNSCDVCGRATSEYCGSVLRTLFSLKEFARAVTDGNTGLHSLKLLALPLSAWNGELAFIVFGQFGRCVVGVDAKFWRDSLKELVRCVVGVGAGFANLKLFARFGADANAVRAARKLDLPFVVLGRG